MGGTEEENSDLANIKTDNEKGRSLAAEIRIKHQHVEFSLSKITALARASI
jgi:hypothetical protein